jgi:hypothetical protein
MSVVDLPLLVVAVRGVARMDVEALQNRSRSGWCREPSTPASMPW